MKYAKALKYGGELVSASDCDHQTFADIVPMCPVCSEVVHLRSGYSSRSKNGKPFLVPSYWAHSQFKTAEDAEICEARVNGYTLLERQQFEVAAKGQRFKVLRQKFRKILANHYGELGIFYGGENTVISDGRGGMMPAKQALNMLKARRKTIQKNRRWQSVIRENVEVFRRECIKPERSEELFDTVLAEENYERARLDQEIEDSGHSAADFWASRLKVFGFLERQKPLNLKIYREVLLFVGSKQAEKLLTELLENSLTLNLLPGIGGPLRDDELLHLPAICLAHDLVMVDWASELQELGSSRKIYQHQ